MASSGSLIRVLEQEYILNIYFQHKQPDAGDDFLAPVLLWHRYNSLDIFSKLKWCYFIYKMRQMPVMNCFTNN